MEWGVLDEVALETPFGRGERGRVLPACGTAGVKAPRNTSGVGGAFQGTAGSWACPELGL